MSVAECANCGHMDNFARVCPKCGSKAVVYDENYNEQDADHDDEEQEAE